MSIDKLAEMVETVSIYNDSLDYLKLYRLDEDNSLAHEYIRFDGNGNLETFSEWKRDEILSSHKDEILEEYNKLPEEAK